MRVIWLILKFETIDIEIQFIVSSFHQRWQNVIFINIEFEYSSDVHSRKKKKKKFSAE